jgi:hypothetical protein
MQVSITSHFQLDQRRDLRTKLELTGRYRLTYSFFRKRSRLEDEDSTGIRYPGDDYITYYYHDEKILFAVCDGVSGGFAGYIASSFLGNRLIDWLQKQDFTTEQAANLLEPLNQHLHAWVRDATNVVNATPFLIPPKDDADRKFKEKRRSKGAQTMFVAGLLDYQNNSADFFWMGNTRLLFDFKDGQKRIQNKIDNWDRYRWSTLEGPKGFPDGCRCKCSDLSRVIVYTDGLPEAIPEEEIKAWEDESFSNLQLTKPPDDVSVLVISILPFDWRKQPVLKVPKTIYLSR